MKNWRFFFGTAFGFGVGYLLDVIEWSWPVKVAVCVMLLLVVEYIVHKIADS